MLHCMNACSYQMNYAFGIAPVSIFVVLRWPCAAGGLDSIFFPSRRLKILPSLLPEDGKAAYAIKQEPSHIVMRGSNLM